MDKVIDTRLVCGFLDAGKTTYIRENIRDDVFYKYGKTLIICFEEGEEEFDPDELKDRNASVVYYDDGDISEFISHSIEDNMPDRVYIEMNTMIPELVSALPEFLKVTFVMMLIDWSTMPVYYTNFIKLFKQMVSMANQITFRGCPSKDLLAPYSQAFLLMNPKASYLRQDPMGYHEKAFDMFLPFSIDEPELTITEERYLPFWLDALDHPEHYDGKIIRLTDPVELRQDPDDGKWSCGRVVMTCCMADLQFMSLKLDTSSICDADMLCEGWVTLDARADVVTGSYGQRRLVLRTGSVQKAFPPEELIMDGRA